jgi:hypothetical protein
VRNARGRVTLHQQQVRAHAGRDLSAVVHPKRQRIYGRCGRERIEGSQARVHQHLQFAMQAGAVRGAGIVFIGSGQNRDTLRTQKPDRFLRVAERARMAGHILIQIADSFNRQIRLQPWIARQARTGRNASRSRQYGKRRDDKDVVLRGQRDERCTNPSAPAAMASLAACSERMCTTASLPSRCAASITARRFSLLSCGDANAAFAAVVVNDFADEIGALGNQRINHRLRLRGR